MEVQHVFWLEPWLLEEPLILHARCVIPVEVRNRPVRHYWSASSEWNMEDVTGTHPVLTWPMHSDGRLKYRPSPLVSHLTWYFHHEIHPPLDEPASPEW